MLLNAPHVTGPKVLKIAARVANSAWAIFVVTIAVRLSVFWQLLPVQGTQGFYKYNEQARIAWAIVSGYGFSSPWLNTPLLPTAQQPPLYSWLLAGIFKLAGPYTYSSLWIAELFNTVFAALTAVLIFKIGKQVLGEWTGVLASWVWACWLHEAAVCLRVWDSSLSALLLMLSVWLLLYLNAKSPLSHWVSFGVLAGISALANTALLSVSAGAWCWLFLRDRNLPRVGKLLVSVCFCVLTLLPWTARNYREFHQLLPVRDNFGFELWLGNHAGAPDVIAGTPGVVMEFNRLGEIGFMESKRDAAVRFIGQDPQRFLLGCGYRFYRFWTDPYVWEWLPLSALAWLGCLFVLRYKVNGMPLIIPMLVFPAAYYVTHPGAPYRHPIEPVMHLLIAFATVTIVHWGVRYRTAAT